MTEPVPPSPSTLARRIEHALLAAGGLLLGAPLALTLLLHFLPGLWPGADWLHNATLFGVGRPPAAVCSWPALGRGGYQAAVERAFNEGFPGREALIRVTNEAWLRIFGASGVTAPDVLAVGPGDTLFQEPYLREYCLERPPAEALDDFVADLARLQAGCRERGVAFAVLLSPSKPAAYPELMPRGWAAVYDSRPRAYEGFRQRLTAARIALVDGPEIIRRAKPTAPAPLFVRGATHWNRHAAFLAADALLTVLRDQGVAALPLQLDELRVTDQPRGPDLDLLELMNLARPWRYPVVELRLRPRPTPEHARLNAVFVGTSFATAPATLLSESGTFSEVDHFSRRGKWGFFDGQPTVLATFTPTVDFEREVFAADALVLELNEAILPRPTYVREVVAHALHHLAAVGSPLPGAKPVFQGDGFRPYAWGEDVRFTADENPTRSGFSQPEPGGTWTDSPCAAVRLRPDAPPPPGDVLLEAEVGALADPGRGLSQAVEVTVNGTRVGRWEFPTGERVRQRLIVPRRLLLDGPRVVLGFQVSHPTAPADIGLGRDQRRLGLRFSALRLRPASAAPGEWGRWLRFSPGAAAGTVDPDAATGFSTPEPAGTWTLGPTATLALRYPAVLPPGEDDLILQADVSPMLDPRPGAPPQRAAVFINDVPVGEWTFPGASPAPGHREARVPRQALAGSGGVVRVRVEVAHPVSPLELRQSQDARPLGLFFSALRLGRGSLAE